MESLRALRNDWRNPSHRAVLFVLVAVLASVPLHFMGLTYGLPLALAGDEFVHVAVSFTMLAEHTLRTTAPFAYVPPLMAYLCMPFYILFILVALPLVGSLGAVQAFVLAHENYFLIAPRFVSGLFFIALLIALFYLARSLFGRAVAYTAVLLAAFDFQIFHESILGHFWLPETFFIVAAFYALVRMRETGERKWYLGAALAIGLGYGMGYLSLLVIPFVPFFYLITRGRSSRFAVEAFAAASALIALFSWLNPVSFIRQFGHAINVAAAALSLPISVPVSVYTGNADVIANIRALLSIAFIDNPVVALLAVLGVIMLLRSRRYLAVAILFVFPALYLIVGSVMWSDPDHRYSLLFIPFFILAAAYATGVFWSRGGGLRVAGIALAASALLYSSLGSLSYARLLTVPDTRLAAREWLSVHAAGAPVRIDAMYLGDAQASTPDPEWYVYGHYEQMPLPPAGFTRVATFSNASVCRPTEDIVGDASRPFEALRLKNLGPCIEIYRRTR